jgi:cation transport regulator
VSTRLQRQDHLHTCRRRADLPAHVRQALPGPAQEIYRNAFNIAYGEYVQSGEWSGSESQEATAHRMAWAAVEQSGYHAGDDGKWHRH